MPSLSCAEPRAARYLGCSASVAVCSRQCRPGGGICQTGPFRIREMARRLVVIPAWPGGAEASISRSPGSEPGGPARGRCRSARSTFATACSTCRSLSGMWVMPARLSARKVSDAARPIAGPARVIHHPSACGGAEATRVAASPRKTASSARSRDAWQAAEEVCALGRFSFCLRGGVHRWLVRRRRNECLTRPLVVIRPATGAVGRDCW